MFKKILVSSDFSDCSQKAVHVAVDLTATYGGELWVVNVLDGGAADHQYDTIDGADDELDEIQNTEKALRVAVVESVKLAVASGKPEVTPERVQFEVRSGKAAGKILEIADENNIDLIVMGTHGRSSIRDFFVGSTTERINREASAAVLAVKPDGYPFLKD